MIKLIFILLIFIVGCNDKNVIYISQEEIDNLDDYIFLNDSDIYEGLDKGNYCIVIENGEDVCFEVR